MNYSHRIRQFAWAGIIGGLIMVGFGINGFISPPQIGDKVVNPSLFQIKNILEIFSFVGYALICIAFYATGATGNNWLAKIAIVLPVLGAITASVINIANAIAIQNVPTPDWSNILLFGLILLSPLFLGASALTKRIIPTWQALYPIFVVGIASLATWIIIGDSMGPSIPAIVQALTWIGFAFIATSA